MSRVMSRNQELVLGVLRAAAGRALTAYQILARLEAAGMRGPQTVYRALEALRQAGLVHRIESLNAFAACLHRDGDIPRSDGTRVSHEQPSEPHRPAFAVCRRCGAVTELEDHALAAVLEVVARRTGYRVEQRVIELLGTCPDCVTAP